MTNLILRNTVEINTELIRYAPLSCIMVKVGWYGMAVKVARIGV